MWITYIQRITFTGIYNSILISIFNTVIQGIPICIWIQGICFTGILLPISISIFNTILGGFGMAGVSIFPTFIPTTLEDGVSLTAFDHSSSQLTLTVMSLVAAIGVPIVLTYTTAIYWVFRGKVQLNEHHSY